MKETRTPPDREFVARFVDYLRSQVDGFGDLKLDSWAEDDTPGQSVVEAIAGKLAIEHTSVDSLPDQRRIGQQFMDALAVVELLPVTARLRIVVPYDLVTVGWDWAAFQLSTTPAFARARAGVTASSSAHEI